MAWVADPTATCDHVGEGGKLADVRLATADRETLFIEDVPPGAIVSQVRRAPHVLARRDRDALRQNVWLGHATPQATCSRVRHCVASFVFASPIAAMSASFSVSLADSSDSWKTWL